VSGQTLKGCTRLRPYTPKGPLLVPGVPGFALGGCLVVRWSTVHVKGSENPISHHTTLLHTSLVSLSIASPSHSSAGERITPLLLKRPSNTAGRNAPCAPSAAAPARLLHSLSCCPRLSARGPQLRGAPPYLCSLTERSMTSAGSISHSVVLSAMSEEGRVGRELGKAQSPFQHHTTGRRGVGVSANAANRHIESVGC
jgi:hypothetical protein